MYDLITPEPGPGICPLCFNFTLEQSGRCRACRACEPHLSAMVPISYARAGGPLHRGLADYKRAAEPAVPDLTDEIARLLSCFLSQHESCIAAAAGVDRFDSVVVVPSSDPRRDRNHPLRRIVATQVGVTAYRYQDALAASGIRCTPHAFDPRRFVAARSVAGRSVLLVDDIWTTGASAQSAAAVLRHAGTPAVAAVVVGRYVNGFWGGIAERLTTLQEHTHPNKCALCCAEDHPRPGLNQDDDQVVISQILGP